jgi:thiol-disulfide isomerase/thioredoxin
MRPLVALVIVLALVIAAAAAGFLTGQPRHDADASASSPAVTPPAATPPAAAPARPRSSKLLPLAEAMKELDLIRPSRVKLADDFIVKTPGGGTFRLSEHRGRVVMINFWATWCPPCLEEMPAMERLHRQHKDAGFTLVAISVDTDPAKVGPFLTSHKLTFQVGLDPRMDLANSYAVRALPSSFIVGPDGRLAALAIGPRHWDNSAAHSLVERMAR